MKSLIVIGMLLSSIAQSQDKTAKHMDDLADVVVVQEQLIDTLRFRVNALTETMKQQGDQINSLYDMIKVRDKKACK